jgi:hypothetical protein
MVLMHLTMPLLMLPHVVMLRPLVVALLLMVGG